MLSDLNRRFQFITNPESHDFDPLYIVSTFLSLPYCDLLDWQLVTTAKTYLLQDMNDGIGNDQETATLSQEEANSASSNSGDSEPPIKCFKHLSRVSILLDQQQSSTVNTRTESTVEELELQHYSSYQPSTKELSLDPLHIG